MSDKMQQSRFGNYQLEKKGPEQGSFKELGRGGFAVVYLGHHVWLHRPAAIKVLHTHLSQQEITILYQNFHHEAQIIAALDHPNIIRVFDFGIQNGVPFLAMDYLPNETLAQRHNTNKPVELSTVVSYVKQVASALQYAHDLKLIHRDVKPENMLIGRKNEIILSDFGIATIAHSTSSMVSPTTNIGTRLYMAPEHINNKPCTASDQYALGITVYKWLSGEFPFNGPPEVIFAQHLTKLPSLLRDKIPTLSPEVENIVLKALEKDYRQRFSNIQDFALELERAASPPPPTEPIGPALEQAASLPPPTEPIGQPVLSRRKIIIGLTTIGITAIAGGALIWATIPHSPYLYSYSKHIGAVNAVAWSPDSGRIASGSSDGTVQVWNAIDGNTLYSYSGYTDKVVSVAWSPDNKLIASGSSDGTVQVRNAIDGNTLYSYSGHTDKVVSVAWSPDSKLIASASFDHTVRVWDPIKENTLCSYSGHTDKVVSVVWSPNSKLIASSSSDGTVQIQNAFNGKNISSYKGHSAAVNAVAWSPDEHHIASGSDDKTVYIWSATNGKNVFTYNGHSAAVNTIVWSPDSRRIASGSSDSTVQVWNASNGKNVFSYKGHSAAVNAVAWSPDGHHIASGSNDKTVQVWNDTPP